MIKRNIGILLAFITLIVVLNTSATSARAQEKTPTPSAVTPTGKSTTPTTKPDTIDILKEKIVEKVDQLNKNNKKVVAGVVGKISDDQLELKADGKTYTVTLDNTVTKVFTGGLDKSENLEVSDIEKGDYIVISGPSIDDQVSANVIYKQTQYIVGIGQITNVDKAAFTVQVISQEKDEITLDVDKNTSQKIVNTTSLEIEKGGFAKYKVGDTLHYVMANYDTAKKFGTAIKTLILPQEFFTEETVTKAPTKAAATPTKAPTPTKKAPQL